MSPGRILLAGFLTLLSLHIGISMELAIVSWIGGIASFLIATGIVSTARPTWGLLFVLFATGGFLGNQILEDWAVEGSWAQTNSLGAGFTLSLLVYLIWLFSVNKELESSSTVLDRDSQTILVWGLLVFLLVAPPDSTIFMLSAVPIAPISIAGIVLAILVLFADRVGGFLVKRLLLLLPLVVIVPLALIALGAGQGPVLIALANMFPSGDGFSETGFSPYQQLRASVFLRPTNRAVMRIESNQRPGQYLAGNRLVFLDADLVWQPTVRPLESLTVIDAESLASGELRYPVDNHHAVNNPSLSQDMTVYGLTNENYIFVPPGTSSVAGQFTTMNKNAADVWTLDFDRGSDRRWKLELDNQPTPGESHPENLLMPEFWDDVLQNRSEEFAAGSRQATAENIVSYFVSRQYALQTNFDSEAPFHDFYLGDKPAYCFWFATGATLALRANGIPSRLVGGYALHEQLSSDLWLVRQRDAHSWVEWQDANGYWHTIDPTPPSIESFFGGYQSSSASTLYHRLAGQWQIFVDRMLENELTANLVRYGGLFILAFLFVREYRRIRGERAKLDSRKRQWQRLWQRFLGMTKLPAHNTWTASTYLENLPTNWTEPNQQAVQDFLQDYALLRFSYNQDQAIRDVEESLLACSKKFQLS
ncbi:MAG: hypothetical protein GKR91_14745 [Pseudomonadales bacterium]|nr:hypothetical protein [Pseudomonadales bacterium]